MDEYVSNQGITYNNDFKSEDFRLSQKQIERKKNQLEKRKEELERDHSVDPSNLYNITFP